MGPGLLRGTGGHRTGSQPGWFCFLGHLATSGDLQWHSWGCHWHPVAGGQGCCYILYSAQDSPRQRPS